LSVPEKSLEEGSRGGWGVRIEAEEREEEEGCFCTGGGAK